MFKALQPLLAERGIHILLSSAKDGRIKVYIEPIKTSDKEDSAFVTPFSCAGMPEELDAELAGFLSQWVTTRSTVTASLSEALAAAEADAKTAADEAKKKAADKSKKPTPGKASTPTPPKVVAAKPTTPSLLDDLPETGCCGTGGENEETGEELDAVLATAPALVDDVVAAVPVPVKDEVVTAAPAPVAAAPEAAPAPATAASVVTTAEVTQDLF